MNSTKFLGLQAVSDPRVVYPLLGIFVAVRAISWASDRIGGYAGQLQPTEALSILEEENSLLLDIRQANDRLSSHM